MSKLLPYIRLLRPWQWHKNLLVFIGVLFAHKWNEIIYIQSSIWLFISFCLCASAVYVFNDFCDRENDKLHPRKKHRPLALGTVGVSLSLTLSLILLIVGLLVASLTSSKIGLIIILFYVIMNILYSKWFKHFVIIDVLVLAASYLLRILVGTDGIGIQMSSWLLLCGMSASMMLGFGKRLAEKYSQNVENHRKVVQEYDETFLLIAITICAAIFLVFYGLYSLDLNSIAVHGRKLILTYPWIIFGVLRYLQILIQKDRTTEDPASLLFYDRILMFIFSGWMLTFIMVVNYARY